MTLEDLKQDTQFLLLTEQQQRFVLTCITNNRDFEAAASAAYECKDDKSARALGRQLKNKAEISQILDKFFEPELPTREAVMQKMWKQIQRTSDGGELNALVKTYIDLAGWDKQPMKPTAAAEKSSTPLDDLLKS